jgi:fumarate reductase flavoprotein subunit
MEQSQWRTDARIVSTVYSRSSDAVQWLHRHIDGRSGSLTQRLAQCCREAGVIIQTGARVTALLRDDRNWVCGVTVSQADGPRTLHSQCVVLACGGFLGDEELMARYFPLYDDQTAREIVLEGRATGDGVRMALAAGAGDDCSATFEVSPDRAPFYPGQLPEPVATLVDNRRTPEGLWVNNVGVRFTNEAAPQAFQAVYRQPNKEFYVLFDRGILETLARRDPALSLDALDRQMPGLIQQDAAIVTDKLGALTAWIRGKTHIVYHTLERYQQCCDAGRDFLFGKPKDYLLPFQKPPFYGFRLGLGLRSTHGPVRTNPMMAVVDRFDAPVPALIACGADIAGLYPGGFVEDRDSIVWAITTGYLAGQHASGFERGMGPAAPCTFPRFTAEAILRGDYYNVGTAPADFKVLGGIQTLTPSGDRITTHLAASADEQGIQTPPNRKP